MGAEEGAGVAGLVWLDSGLRLKVIGTKKPAKAGFFTAG